MTRADIEIDRATTRRPAAHFTPREHWINDPNGLIFHGGLWHIYYQHNPYGADWGNMSWGHATSPDLTTWTEHAVAIERDDDAEIFSGSVVFDADHSSGLGETPPLVAFYTAARQGSQAQALAWSVDGGYSWTKHGVVLDRRSSDFRDPKVFRHGDRWIMVAVEAHDRQVHIFGSSDLLEWEPLSVFGPAGSTEGIWECPDLFELDGRWVLVVSTNPGGVSGGSGMQYFVGDFDGVEYRAETNGWLDWGRDFYAGVTFNDAPRGERVMLAWMSNWDYAATVPSHPWRGSFTLPRRLRLVDGKLAQTIPIRPAQTLETLQRDDFRSGRVIPTHGGLVRLAVSGRSLRGEEFALAVNTSADGEEAVVVTVKDGTVSVDRTRATGSDFDPLYRSVSTAPLRERQSWDLEIWLDSSSIEVLADGGTVAVTEQIPGSDTPDTATVIAGHSHVTSMTAA